METPQTHHHHHGFSIVQLIGMGLAAWSSWMLNHSIGWACIHTLFGWLYMIYLCMGFGGGLPPGLF